MSAVEEIQEAIVKLTESKKYLTACPEYQYDAVRHIARNCELGHECDSDACGWDRYETAPALDMLVRTVDAQLAILEAAVGEIFEWEQDPDVGYKAERMFKIAATGRAALQLARAITGGTQ